MKDPNCDWVIRNGWIVDGSGKPGFRGEVAVRGDRIVGAGILDGVRGEREVDAAGRVVCPGFVDAHIHTDLRLLDDRDQKSSLAQGVTAHVIGQDGTSYAPASAAAQRRFRDYFAAVNGDPDVMVRWESVAGYLDAVDGAAVNVAYLAPHGTIRFNWLGDSARAPTLQELAGMKSDVAQAMADGAVGLSTGLEYLPGSHAATDELVQVCEPVAEAGGVYVTHMRSYQPAFVAQAFREVLEIGRRARLPVHISHLNGTAEMLVPLLDEARRAGDDVTFETYPYLAGCTILGGIALPDWVKAASVDEAIVRLRDPHTRARLGDWFESPVYPWKCLQITSAESPGDHELEGMRIPEAARARGQNIGDFVCDLLIRARFRVAAIVHHTTRTEADMIQLMQRPEHMGGSDGIYTGSRPHPRGYGSFARFLEYARDHRVLPVEAMVRHLTGSPAARFQMRERGRVEAGSLADLLVFDLKRIRAEATYEDGAKLASGMDWVFVNGEPTVAEGKFTGAHAGRAVRCERAIFRQTAPATQPGPGRSRGSSA